LNENYAAQTMPVNNEPDWGITETTSQRNMRGYRCSPDKVKGEGFFIAAVKKTEASDTMRPPKFKQHSDKKIWQQCAWLLTEGDYTLLPASDNSYTAINTQHEADYHQLKDFVFLRKVGVNIGQPSAKEWIPAHELALSIHRSVALPGIAVSREQALHFLKKEDFNPDLITKGWYLVSYEGLALGWIKALGNRVNNYLPKSWRIRMEIPDEDHI